MLVGALEEQVGGEFQVGRALQPRPPRTPRLEPDVEDVLLLTERIGVKAWRIFEVVAEQLSRRIGEPRVAPLLIEAFGDGAHRLRREQRLTLGVAENRDRQTPAPLTRDSRLGGAAETSR